MTRARYLLLPFALLFLFPAPTLTEDSPAWNCTIHGNRICGPGVEVRGWHGGAGMVGLEP